MIYFTPENIAFIHIPKCGGTSVFTQIKKCKSGRWNRIWGAHTDIKTLNINGHTFKKYLIQVRNPYDRFLSAYYHQLTKKEKKDRVTIDRLLQYLKDDNVNDYIDKDILRRQIEWLDESKNMKIFKLEDKTIWSYLQKIDSSIREKKSKPYIGTKIELTEEQKKIIYTYYKQDFERFGYNE